MTDRKKLNTCNEYLGNRNGPVAHVLLPGALLEAFIIVLCDQYTSRAFVWSRRPLLSSFESNRPTKVSSERALCHSRPSTHNILAVSRTTTRHVKRAADPALVLRAMQFYGLVSNGLVRGAIASTLGQGGRERMRGYLDAMVGTDSTTMSRSEFRDAVIQHVEIEPDYFKAHLKSYMRDAQKAYVSYLSEGRSVLNDKCSSNDVTERIRRESNRQQKSRNAVTNHITQMEPMIRAVKFKLELCPSDSRADCKSSFAISKDTYCRYVDWLKQKLEQYEGGDVHKVDDGMGESKLLTWYMRDWMIVLRAFPLSRRDVLQGLKDSKVMLAQYESIGTMIGTVRRALTAVEDIGEFYKWNDDVVTSLQEQEIEPIQVEHDNMELEGEYDRLGRIREEEEEDDKSNLENK